MTIEIKVNNVDKTNDVVLESIAKNDTLNNQKDELKFQVLRYGDVGFEPEINQDVKFYVDNELEFGGVIVSVENTINAGIVVQNISCSDYTYLLDRQLVLKKYQNKTVKQIIDDIVTNYCDGFTTNNVNCNIELDEVVFNRVTPSEAIDQLAQIVNYSWYVDYEKDIHFFEYNNNPAPFLITDTNGNYLEGTLKITKDLSQLRNKVTIRGDEERGEERSEQYEADGDQLVFPLANKFAEMPTVMVDSVAKNVGVDYLTPEDDADCFWNYNEKYIRFKDTTKPSAGQIVKITGIPLFPVIVNAVDGVSVAQYGVFEFFKEDKSLKSRAEALKFAKAQLESYKNGIIEGEFSTDKSGLRSGQVITINSELLGVNEEFLIQSVNMTVQSPNKAVWNVKLATMRTVGIIKVLQDLIKFREYRTFDPDNLLSLIQFQDLARATDSLTIPSATTSSPYYWWPNSGTGTNPPIKWNYWTWSA